MNKNKLAASIALFATAALLSSAAMAVTTICTPIAGLSQISWGFPMSVDEYNSGTYDGPVGDYSGGFLGYGHHAEYFIGHVCHVSYAAQGGQAADCVYNEQYAGQGYADGNEAAPYGWNLYYAGCGKLGRASGR